MRNVLFAYDKDPLDCITITGAARAWAQSKGNGTEVEVIEIHPLKHPSTLLNQLILDELLIALSDGKKIDNLAIVSGGSSLDIPGASPGAFNMGFIHVLEGLFSSLYIKGDFNPFVALRSKWIETTGRITAKTKGFTPRSLNELLEKIYKDSTAKTPDDNHREVRELTMDAVRQAPDEIFTISKASRGCLNAPEMAGLFDFFDKAFGGKGR